MHMHVHMYTHTHLQVSVLQVSHPEGILTIVVSHQFLIEEHTHFPFDCMDTQHYNHWPSHWRAMSPGFSWAWGHDLQGCCPWWPLSDHSSAGETWCSVAESSVAVWHRPVRVRGQGTERSWKLEYLFMSKYRVQYRHPVLDKGFYVSPTNLSYFTSHRHIIITSLDWPWEQRITQCVY